MTSSTSRPLLSAVLACRLIKVLLITLPLLRDPGDPQDRLPERVVTLLVYEIIRGRRRR